MHMEHERKVSREQLKMMAQKGSEGGEGNSFRSHLLK